MSLVTIITGSFSFIFLIIILLLILGFGYYYYINYKLETDFSLTEEIDPEPTNDAPINDAPTNDAPINNTPTNNAPTDDTPINDTPINNTPINNISVPVIKYEGVYAYDNDNYGSLLGKMKEGSFSFKASGSYPKLNNDISSFRISKGYQVTLYDDEKYKTKIGVFTKDIPTLGKYKNMTSSLIIKKK